MPNMLKAPIIKNYVINQIHGGFIMQRLTHKTMSLFLVISVSLLILVIQSCDKNTTEPAVPELQLSKGASEGLVSSWQTIHSVQTMDEMKNMLSAGPDTEQGEFDGITSVKEIRGEYAKMQKDLKVAIAGKTAGMLESEDSLLWFIDWTDPISGVSVRKALYYNSMTGIARYYEAIYRYPEQLRLAYDSTEVKANLNFTLANSADDKFISLTKLTLFKEGFFVRKIEAEAVATDYDAANKVTGATASNHVWYGDQSKLDQLTQNLEINPDESGSIRKRLDYRDGTFLEKMINFYADYTGDFSETWRNGTQVSGTFDRLEDDNHARVERTVDFPTGYLLDRIQQLVDITLNPDDSTTMALFNEKLFFNSGRLDTSQVEVTEYYESGLKKTHLVTARSDGSQADLLVTAFPEYQDLEGSYTGPQGYYSLIHAIFYTDGSGELWLTVYQNESAYQNGEPALATIYVHFYPDGSGEGEITENEDKYTVQVQPSGNIVVRNDQGSSKTVSGY